MTAKSLIKSCATFAQFSTPPDRWMLTAARKIAARYNIPAHQIGIVARMIAEHQPAQQSATERAEYEERQAESEYSHSDGAHRD